MTECERERTRARDRAREREREQERERESDSEREVERERERERERTEGQDATSCTRNQLAQGESSLRVCTLRVSTLALVACLHSLHSPAALCYHDPQQIEWDEAGRRLLFALCLFALCLFDSNTRDVTHSCVT